MSSRLVCPSCGASDLDLHDYESMIVISDDHALFSVRCAGCGTRVASVRAIPSDMYDEVLYAAIEVGAGMGHSS